MKKVTRALPLIVSLWLVDSSTRCENETTRPEALLHLADRDVYDELVGACRFEHDGVVQSVRAGSVTR